MDKLIANKQLNVIDSEIELENLKLKNASILDATYFIYGVALLNKVRRELEEQLKGDIME